MKKFVVIFTVFLCSFPLAFSQRQQKIDSDRPGQSISPLTVGKQVLQVQTGFNYFNKDFSDNLTVNSYSNITNVRFGILESLELNSALGFRINANNYKDTKSNIISSGVYGLRLGARFNILNEKGLTPKVAVNGELIIALRNSVYSFIKNGYELKLSVRQPLTDKLSLTSNVGIFDNPIFPILFYPYTLNVSFSFNDELFAFAEIYGLLNKEVTVNYNGGMGYYLNKDLLLDLSLVKVTDDVLNNWFIEVGASYRLGGDNK